MPLIVWVAASLIAFAVPLAWWALSGDRHNAAREHLASYQPTQRQAILDQGASSRFLLPALRTVGQQFVRFTPYGWIENRQVAIARAGWTGRVTPEQVLGAKVLVPVVFGLLLLNRVREAESLGDVLVFVAVLFAGFIVPDLLVRSKADRRAEAIELTLPDFLDQLTISVEAGLGFESALSRIVVANPNQPLSDEFGRTLQDIKLGTPRVDALDDMAERTQVDDLRTVVLTLRQAESMGVPLADSLRNVAAEMRERRRFRAEERAHRLPVTMIFPLGLCIFPALFIVILGPAMIQILDAFAGLE